MEANAEACEAAVEKSLSLVTGLEPLHRLRAGRGVGQGGVRHRQDDPRAVPREERPPAEQLDEALDPWRMTAPAAREKCVGEGQLVVTGEGSS